MSLDLKRCDLADLARDSRKASRPIIDRRRMMMRKACWGKAALLPCRLGLIPASAQQTDPPRSSVFVVSVASTGALRRSSISISPRRAETANGLKISPTPGRPMM